MAEASKAVGSLPTDNAEHQAPPVLHLEHHHLAKLIPKDHPLPPVGSKIRISGLLHVGSHSEHQDQPPSGGKAKGGEGNTRRTLTGALHDMEMGKAGVDGVSQVDQEEKSKAGAKAEMDKALTKAAGHERAKGKKETGIGSGTPRGGGDAG